jgi:hypothetical protein
MNHNRPILIVLSLLAMGSLLLAACGPAATPVPTIAPTAPTAAAGGSLSVTGLVDKELNLAEADLRAMKIADVTAVQPKVGSVSFTGVRMSDLMAAAQVKPGAISLEMTGSDGYSATIDLATLKACTDCMVAFTGTPGSFLSVMPGMPGKLWVKELAKLDFQ